jgi:HB1, ASXL, restriction endonuclease HTH domain/Restriction endonuclease
MTFLEAALEILRRERRPLHYKDIAQKAMDKKLLTFVGRTPEVTMQTQLTAAIKKAPGNPFVRVKPGTFGLLRYPEAPVAPEPEVEADEAVEEGEAVAASGEAGERAGGEARGRRRRRGGRGRRGREGGRETREGAARETREGAGREAQGAGATRETREGRAAPAGRSGAPSSNVGGRAKQPTENGATSRGPQRSAREETMADDDENAAEEPEIGSLSPEDRAAALGVLGAGAQGDEDEDQDEDEDEEDIEEGEEAGAAAGGEEGDDDLAADEDDDDEDDEDEEDEDEEDEDEDEDEEVTDEERPAVASQPPAGGESGGAELAAGAAGLGGGTFEEGGPGRRRRRRRRRRGAGEAGFFGEGGAPTTSGGTSGGAPEASTGEATVEAGDAGDAGGAAAPAENGDPNAGRRIMSPVDAAIEILRGQAPGRGMHVRQLADAATRRRLVHGEPNEAWRVMRAALAAEPRERLRTGLRPRVRPAGSGLFALSRRPPDLDLERAEHVFGEARRALRERTLAGLEQRLTELSPSAFEAIARVLLQREGFGPATFVKRVEGTVYLECLRGRGARPSRCLVALRPGAGPAGRRSIGELRAGIRARGQDEGVLLLAARLAEDAIAEWKQPGSPIEVADGPALAETCVRHGVGVINTMVSVDFVDADFFAELQEG